MNQTEQLSVFITGANGGMGLDTSKILVSSGIHRLVMATRTMDKAVTAKSKIDTAYPDHQTQIEVASGFDMTDPKAIEKAVHKLPKDQPFNIIFLQAGGVIFSNDYSYLTWNNTAIEKTIFQNVIGPYITLLQLKKHGLIAPNARVVFAGGEGARGIPGMIEKPVFDTINDFKNYIYGKGNLPKYNPMNAIGVSKLMGAVLSQKLSSLEKNMDVIWFTPGLTYGTNGLAAKPAIQRWFMEKIMFGIAGFLGFAQSPMQGAQKYVDCLLGIYGKNGDVLGAPEGKVLGDLVDQKPMNQMFTNTALQDEFWHILNTIYMPYHVI